MDEGNLAILVDAKTEYTKQLVNIISPNIFKGIKSIYNNAKNNSLNNDTLVQFQNDLSQIPKWNQEVINEHYNSLVHISNCDWLEDLLTAVFVSHTRILTSINFSKNKNKINLKIPKVDHFIHLCYIEVARIFWKNPYLFDDTISKFEYQRNRRDGETIIDNTINETIRKQLPVKHILKEYLGNEFKEANTDFTVNENNIEHENLRKMVKAEIENCSKEKLEKLNINSLDLDLKSKEDVNINENRIKHFESLEKNNIDMSNPETKLDNSETKLDNSETKLDNSETKLDNSETKLDNSETKLDNSEKSTELTNKLKQSDNEISKLDPVKIDELNNTLSDVELDIENTINNEIDNLKIETLNLNIDDDLSNLDEIYIDTPDNKLENLNDTKLENLNDTKLENLNDTKLENLNDTKLENLNDIDNKIKTVYIETSDKSKKKNTFNDTDIELNYDDENNYKDKKYSKQDFNFFN